MRIREKGRGNENKGLGRWTARHTGRREDEGGETLHRFTEEYVRWKPS